jgi:hypothetical protein
MCDAVLNDVVCDSLQDCHALVANKCQIVFGGIYLLANGLACPLPLTFLFDGFINIPSSVELYVQRGVMGWMWPNSVSVTLSGAPPWAF